MPVDPSLIAALEAALAGDPQNDRLRLHLAQLLLEGHEPAAALGHLEVILAHRPDHLGALRLAAEAATALGDLGRAAGWRRLHASLASDSGGEELPGGGEAPVRAGPEGDGDETELSEDWDALLADVLAEEGGGPQLTLADVGGLEDVKRRLDATFLGPLRNPKLRRMYRKSLRGGLLLWGPPGCGKTLLARAVAGELGARFLSVGLHEVLDMWFGRSEQKLHAVFEAARRRTPCVLFLDEIDALGHKRANLVRSAGRNVVVQLLTELDGITEENEGLFVLAASNQPWDIDAALRRPGRLDRTVLVLPPDEPARLAILDLHLRELPTEDLDLAGVARRTEGYSGADLRLVCDAAAERALQTSIATGEPEPIATPDLLAAVDEVRSSTGPWFESARNYATFSNQAGEYDELVAYLRSHRP